MGVAIAAYRMYIVITRVYSSNIITYFHFLHIDFKFSFAAVMFPLLNFFGCSDPLPNPRVAFRLRLQIETKLAPIFFGCSTILFGFSVWPFVCGPTSNYSFRLFWFLKIQNELEYFFEAIISFSSALLSLTQKSLKARLRLVIHFQLVSISVVAWNLNKIVWDNALALWRMSDSEICTSKPLFYNVF